ncbi:methionine synthase [bacterium]|nr:methionine synthase [bacterium]
MIIGKERIQSLLKLIKSKILVIDGAMGTSLQDENLTETDFGGEELNGCNEYLVITRPNIISKVHESYLEAGADIVETNTFGATPLVLDEFGIGEKAVEINTIAVQLARAACDKYSTPEKPRFVAGSIGPTTKALSVTGGITFDELRLNFKIQAKALVEAGADYLLIETALDTLNIKAAYIGCLDAFEEVGQTLPVAVSGTVETMGTMLGGQTVEALYTSIEHMKPLYIGLNCATGPEFMRDHIRSLAEISKYPIAVVPNAGIPNEDGIYPEKPENLASTLKTFIDEGWLNVIGGCCGTTPSHIQSLSEIADTSNPRTYIPESMSRVSGIETVVFENENRPYIVGERSNVIGSRKFKRLIVEGSLDEAAEIAKKQVKAGAHVVDICMSNPDRDEVQDTIDFYQKISKMVKAPIMVDSQDPEVVETAFKLTQGKCILNSVNLEDGEKSFEELLPLVRKYGAAVVVGCIHGEMAVTAEEKLQYATDSYELLTKKYGILEEDIIFDPLVFPCGTGDENYFGSGKETIEGVRLIKEKYPKTKSTLGISNVSFGLPPAGREVLNSVFLYHCTKAGLDTAIVNSEKLVRFSTISDEEKELCDNLLWYRTEFGDPVAKFAAFYRDKKVVVKTVSREHLSTDKKIEINIVEGTKEFLIENLDEALKKLDPLGVINGPLMAAMAIVGRLFNNNELIVAEVLQSAEVMKAAVSYLEPMMESEDSSKRATMLLATVKGDVHDIGKNLVEIIFGNNGYNIVDLGIKCPPEKLIEAFKKHKPQLIGLSGLLVKSAQQMVITAGDLARNGIDVPILVGGAALSENFTNLKIAAQYEGAVVYCKDAMSGLEVANKLSEPSTSSSYISEIKEIQKKAREKKDVKKVKKPIHRPEINFEYTYDSIGQPFVGSKKVEAGLEDIWDYINPQMLYGNHLGLKGNVKSLLANKDEKAMKLNKLLTDLKKMVIEKGLLKGKAVYKYFNVKKKDNHLQILDESDSVKNTFIFPRQSEGNELCLTDFVHPDKKDTICAFVVTCGDGISDLAKELMNEGRYFEAHGLQAIALEAAEGFAEKIHQQIRREWGFPDDENQSRDDLFKLKYRGIRVSFGYPACPRLEDQSILWDVLSPDKEIGVELSEECMMEPEASVSALVFHHPQARYFRINDEDLETFVDGLSK